MSSPRIAATVALAALLLGGPAVALAQHDSVAGMAMPGHVMIPKGAIYTEADVLFMQGMIAHHAQAIYMSRLAAAHGANPRVTKFAIKIDQSQIAEIRIMQEWLRRYSQFAPDTGSWRTMTMPGMLTAALSMVKDLFATPRAGQEVDVSVFANDVVSVQTAEIGVMQQMIGQLPGN